MESRKILLVFGSTTGNTESMAEMITDVLSENHEVELSNISDIEVEDIAEYDSLIIGSSTWDDGELQYDMVDFHEELDDVDLSGKKVSVFGPGDSSYEEFCKAVDMFEEASKKAGGEVVVSSLKVDGYIYDSEEDIQKWAKEVSEKI